MSQLRLIVKKQALPGSDGGSTMPFWMRNAMHSSRPMQGRTRCTWLIQGIKRYGRLSPRRLLAEKFCKIPPNRDKTSCFAVTLSPSTPRPAYSRRIRLEFLPTILSFLSLDGNVHHLLPKRNAIASFPRRKRQDPRLGKERR